MKYLVHYVRIEHQVYRLEVEADSKDHAEDIAEQEFSGSESYDVVHAEEFINQVDELFEEYTERRDCELMTYGTDAENGMTV